VTGETMFAKGLHRLYRDMFRAISNIHRRPGAGTVSIDDLSGPHVDLLRVVASELQVEVHLDRVTSSGEEAVAGTATFLFTMASR
jgi:hypothetical protein